MPRAFDSYVRGAVAETTPFLSRVGEGARESLLATGHRFGFVPGQLIFDLGEAQWSGVIITGIARVFSADESGRVLTHRTVGRGGVIGLAALIAGSDTAAARAVVATSVYRFDQTALDRLRATDAAFNLAVAREIHEWLVGTSTEAMLWWRGNLAKRLALEVLKHVVEGDVSSAPTVSVTHEFLAESLGTSREVVTRQLIALSSLRLVRQVARGQLQLLDPGALSSLGHDRRGSRGIGPASQSESARARPYS